MDHRLPVTLLLVACASDPAAGDAAAPPDTKTTSAPELEQPYRFEWDMDGERRIVGSKRAMVVEAHSDQCDSAWALVVAPDQQPGIGLPKFGAVWRATEPLMSGQQTAAGDANTYGATQGIGLEDESGQYEVNAPVWVLEHIDRDVLEFSLFDGTYCSYFEPANCQSFDTLSIRLVESDLPFDPSFAWCRIAPTPDPGEPCWGGSGPDGDPDRDALYEPCP